MTDQPSTRRITIEAPDPATILAARHLDATEGRVQTGATVDSATRAAVTRVLDYVARAHNSPATLDLEGQLDVAYCERAHLTALLASHYPSVIAPAPDTDEPGWQILYLQIDGMQASWHISPRDADLYAHVEHVPVDDRRAQWNGHTTEEKYRHIDTVASRLYTEARGLTETPMTPAATCSARYTGVLPMGECIRAAGHIPTTDHTDDRGRSWGDNRAEYPVMELPAGADSAPWAYRVEKTETSVDGIRALYQQWVLAGPPPLGMPIARWWDARLVELHRALPEHGAVAARSAHGRDFVDQYTNPNMIGTTEGP